MTGMSKDICTIFIEDAEGRHQLDDDDLSDQRDSSSYTDGSISPLSPVSPYGYPVSEEPPRYMEGGQNIPLGRTRRSLETALTAAFMPSFGARDRSASVNSPQRHLSSPTSPFAVNANGNESFPYSDFLTPPLYQRPSQPSLQVNTDIPFGFSTPPPGSASPELIPASPASSPFASPDEYRPQSSSGYSDHDDLSPTREYNADVNPYRSSTSLLLHPEVPRGRSLRRFDDEYLMPGSNPRSLSLASMPNLDDLDHDFLGDMRSPSVAPSTHSDSGIDSSDIFHFDLNPSVGTSDIFGDIAEQQTSRLATDVSLSPMSYREQVASDAVAQASQSRRNNATNYTCNECNQTFTTKHNFNNHLNSHYGVRNFRCEVPNCNKSFGTSHVRRRHMLKWHSESAEAKKRKPRKRFSSSVAKVQFSSGPTYLAHWQNENENDVGPGEHEHECELNGPNGPSCSTAFGSCSESVQNLVVDRAVS